MAYAIIRAGGKQLKIEEGARIDLLGTSDVAVLMFADGATIAFGTPTLSDYGIKLAHVEEKRTKKVTIARFRAKSRYRKVNGHRQPIHVFKVLKIGKGIKTEVVSNVAATQPMAETRVAEAKKAPKAPKVTEAKKTTTKVKAEKETTKVTGKVEKMPKAKKVASPKVKDAPKKRGRPKKEEK